MWHEESKGAFCPAGDLEELPVLLPPTESTATFEFVSQSQVWTLWCQWGAGLWICKMQSFVSSNHRFSDGLCSFFLLPGRAGRNLSHCSSEPFFLQHPIGISPPEYSKIWISVTESLTCIILFLDSWEQSSLYLSVRCPWSHLETPRLKKIGGSFSQWWLVLVLSLKCTEGGRMRIWLGLCLMFACISLTVLRNLIYLMQLTCHFNAIEFGIES